MMISKPTFITEAAEMKLLVLFCIFYFTYADDNGDSIRLIFHDVVGNAKLGVLPQPLAPPNYEDLEETESLKTIVDLLRRMAGVGVHDIPVFDPYNAGDLEPIDLFGILGVSGTLDISNLVVNGLQKYEHPKLLLQANNLTIQDAKLITFIETFPKLDFTADLKANITYLNIKSDIIICEVKGSSQGVTNSGSLGVERWLLPSDKIGRLAMNIVSFEIKNLIKVLELNFIDVKMLNDKARKTDISQSEIVKILANKVSLAVAKAVQKQLNDILNGFRADQVEAYLLPRMVDE